MRRALVHFTGDLRFHRIVPRTEKTGVRGGLKYETTAPILGKSVLARWLRGTASVGLILPVSV